MAGQAEKKGIPGREKGIDEFTAPKSRRILEIIESRFPRQKQEYQRPGTKETWTFDRDLGLYVKSVMTEQGWVVQPEFSRKENGGDPVDAKSYLSSLGPMKGRLLEKEKNERGWGAIAGMIPENSSGKTLLTSGQTDPTASITSIEQLRSIARQYVGADQLGKLSEAELRDIARKHLGGPGR